MRALVYNGARDVSVEGYEHFDARDDGWTKVVLNPAA
jgi:hypothetical protein